MILTTTEQFKKVTGYDIGEFFNNYTLFVESFYPDIVDYYNGAESNQDAFNFYDFLVNETSKIEPLIDQFGENFNSTDFWDLNNLFSEIQIKLSTINSLGRWLRSSRTNRYSDNVKIDYIQKQNETIESISKKSGINDRNNWANIALNNQTIEEDYTNIGGVLFKIDLPNGVAFGINNIVDNLIGDNLSGKDIFEKVEIQSDGDLNVISGKEAVQQTFKTILGTIQGSIPEFPEDGVPSFIYGSNENIIQYPVILRSFLNIIRKDQRFISFELLDINKREDNISIEFQSETINSNELNSSIII